MAKPLTVQFQGESIDFALGKVDRAKLYGYLETEVLDESGRRCELATLAGDGHSVVGKGGTSLAYISADGLWEQKGNLKPVDLQGHVITPVKSTFDTPVTLEAKASVDDYLAHNVHLVYQLTAQTEHPGLLAELRKGTIFQFPFSYRGGLEASAGFLLLGSDGNVFLCVGSPTAIEFVGLSAPAATAAAEEEASAEDDESLDFSLV